MIIVETGLAFVEGLALIVSPCILPVLPLVLAASADGGRRRPFGVIAGFILSFSLFALLSRSLVRISGIDVDTVRSFSLVLLLAFGAVLLSPRLSEKFAHLTQGLAGLGNRLQPGGGAGFCGGLGIGMLIGLVWTPCAGPILAAVLVQIIQQTNTASGFMIILSFALGAGIPMLAIALTGRKLLGAFPFFTAHAEGLRRGFGAVIVLAVLFIASGADLQGIFPVRAESAPDGASLTLQNGLEAPYDAPGLAGLQGWINSDPLTMEALKGKVVLVDFWTYSCINCIRTLPYITAWDRKYRDQGLVIIGVHAPEFEFEKNEDNVRKAVAKYGIEYPVALDNALSTWQNFHNLYWPAHYLIDRGGKVVYTHFGEGHYDVTENNIRYLLGLKSDSADDAGLKEQQFSSRQTPETYLGYARAARYDGMTGPDAKPTEPDHWALSGKWTVGPEKIVSGEPGAAIRLDFTARNVFLVLGTVSGGSVKVRIMLNGKPTSSGNDGKDVSSGMLTVDGHALYELVDQKDVRHGILEVIADEPGLEAYAFTFGS